MRKCSECGRELPAAVIPVDASAELKAAFQASARNCKWCLATNLLAGDFDPAPLLSSFSDEDVAAAHERAAVLREERLVHWRSARAMRRHREANQGSLVA